MDNKKISFIICTNNRTFLEECRVYIEKLIVPDGMTKECVFIEDAVSMLSGYRSAINKTDALYKVFMHQDVFILNRSFIGDILSIFESDDNIGMIGMAGVTHIPENYIMWTGERLGRLFVQDKENDYGSYHYDVRTDGFREAEAVDGLLIAVKGDPILRDDVFDGWDLYDLSMSFEMRLSGRTVVVPVQRMPWCMHDDGGVLSMFNYNRYRKRAMKLYSGRPGTIIVSGGFVTLEYFAKQMAGNSGAVIVDIKKTEDTLAPIIDEIDSDTVVITFNNIGAGFALWKQRNVSLYNILVDHPTHYLEAIASDYYPGYHVCCVDRGHVEFLKDVFKPIQSAFSFMPHGGVDIGGMNRDKDIDILYVGGFKTDDEINFVPLPFGDSEAFFDHAIAYYDRENYVEAQDAAKSYCSVSNEEYSIEQKAVMTNYIARSVECFFTAQRRKGIVEFLADNGFKVHICGNECWKETALEHPDSIVYEGMKTPGECLDYISRAKVLINDQPYFAEGAHERIFNGMLNGAVVLSNESRYLEERFRDGESILFWDGRDYGSATEKIKKVLGDDDLRQSIAANARELCEHDTWKDRMHSIVYQ